MPRHLDQLICLLIHPQYKVKDATGKVWWFELHPQCGPQPLDKKDGDPVRLAEDHPFWEAYGKWWQKHRPPPDPSLPKLNIKPEKKT